MVMEAFKLVGEISLKGGEAVKAGLDSITSNTKTAGTGFTGLGAAAQRAGATMTAVGSTSSAAYRALPTELRAIAREMGSMDEKGRAMFQQLVSMHEGERQAQRALKTELMANQVEWTKLGMSAKNYQGTTAGFLAQVTALGAAQKVITDQMLKANEMAKVGLIQQVGTLLNMSTQSSKIAANYQSWGNPLYNASNGALALSGKLEQVARQGNASVIALRMLGPQASMKDLQNQVGLINQGLTRFGAVALAAGLASVVLYGSLHKAAMGNAEYKNSFETMLSTLRTAFQPMVDVFTQVMTKVYDAITVIANMIIEFNKAHPVLAKIIQGFLLLVPAVTLLLSPLAIGVGLINGFAAAFSFLAPLIMPLVTGFAALSGPVLLVIAGIVALTAAGVALYQNWDTVKAKMIELGTAIKTKFLQDWNDVKTGVLAVGTAVSSGVTTAWNAIKQFFVSWGQSIKTQFTNDWNQVKTGLSTAWDAIKQVFQTAIDGIKVVAEALTTFFLNYTPLGYVIQTITKNKDEIIQLFTILKDMVVAVWNLFWDTITNYAKPKIEAIKTTISNAWKAIETTTKTVFNAIKSFLQTIITAWLNLVKTNLNLIKTAFQTVWNAVKTVTTTVFNAIKSFLSPYLNTLKSLFTNATKAIQTTFTNAWNKVKSITSSVFNSVKSTLSSIWNSIKSTISSVASSIASTVSSKFNTAKNNMVNPIKDAYNKIKGFINNILSTAKGMKWSIPLPKIPKINVDVKWGGPGNKIPYPSFRVTWGAYGGILDRAQLIGAGEAGKEMLLPLEGKYFKPVAGMIAEQMKELGLINQAGSGGVSRIEVPVYLNGREFARAVASDVDKALEKERQRFATFRGVRT